MRDITIGQYYPADSVLHRLDPRVKLIATFVFLFSLFIGNGIAAYAIATIFLAMVIKLSKIPFKIGIVVLEVTAFETIFIASEKTFVSQKNFILFSSFLPYIINIYLYKVLVEGVETVKNR